MKSTGRGVVVGIAIALIMGVGWHGMRLAKPRKGPWPAERVTAMRQEMLAIHRVSGHSDKNPWSCDNVRAVNVFADVQARSGELEAARAAISSLS